MTSATTRTTPEQLYRLLADNATDVVTLHDLAGHYLYVSPSVMTLGGYEPEDIIGQPVETTARCVGGGVIPGGIETDGQLERLVAMGCDHAQGFLLSRPLPAGELEGLL